MDGETEYDVALYGGYAVIDVDENITIQNYTGNIEVQGHTLIISGDGTVTFTDGED
jgi:pectin methylesterase-like acyl-CoA thioesterase